MLTTISLGIPGVSWGFVQTRQNPVALSPTYATGPSLTSTTVRQTQLAGDFFSIEMAARWYDENSERGIRLGNDVVMT